MPRDDETARVVAPPPLIFGTALVTGWLLNWLVPAPVAPVAFARGAGALLAAGGLAFGVMAWRELGRAATAVNPYRPTTSLVRSGAFAYSRNPLYVALIALSLGAALLANALWCVVALVPAVAVLRLGVISREEAYLERRFGEQYRVYRAATRRWL